MLDIHKRVVGSNSVTWLIKREAEIIHSSSINILINLALRSQRINNPILQLNLLDSDNPEDLELAPVEPDQLHPFVSPPAIPFEHDIETIEKATDHVLIQQQFPFC